MARTVENIRWLDGPRLGLYHTLRRVDVTISDHAACSIRCVANGPTPRQSSVHQHEASYPAFQFPRLCFETFIALNRNFGIVGRQTP